MNGLAGADSLVGGNGTDTADYSTFFPANQRIGVVVNLATGDAVGDGADLLSLIENVRGSAFDDRLLGNGQANTLQGTEGNDYLFGGAGRDTLRGGSGSDTLQARDGLRDKVFGDAQPHYRTEPNEFLGRMVDRLAAEQWLDPKGKKALYLGYVNIPVGVGQAIGAYLTAYLYARWGEKAVLSQRYLAEHPDLLGRTVDWNGDPLVLETATGVSREEAFSTLCTALHQDGTTVTRMLWDTYDPWVVWLPIAGIGVISVVGLFAFAKAATRWKDMDH